MTAEEESGLRLRVAELEAEMRALRSALAARRAAGREDSAADFGGDASEPAVAGRASGAGAGVAEAVTHPPFPDANSPENDVDAAGNETPLHASLEIVGELREGFDLHGPPGEVQIYGFRDMLAEGSLRVLLEAVGSAGRMTGVRLRTEYVLPDGAVGQALVPARFEFRGGRREIRWMPLPAASGSVALDLPDPGAYQRVYRFYQEALEEEGRRGDDPERIVVPYDPEDWRTLGEEFWLLGGDETECYGSAVGNAHGAAVISLEWSSPGLLLRGDWGADGFGVTGDLNVWRGLDVSGTLSTGSLRVAGTPYTWRSFRVDGTYYDVLAQ